MKLSPSQDCESKTASLSAELPQMLRVLAMSFVQGFELVFYGDSISEDWRGTSAGIPWPLASGTADVFYKHFGSKYNAEVLAIAGGRPKLLACQPAAIAMLLSAQTA